MYTLRTFKDKTEIERTQTYLGDSYVVKGACKEDEKLGIKFRVYGNWDSYTKEGLAIYNDDYAFIMTQLGGTFETLNRPLDNNEPKITSNGRFENLNKYECELLLNSITLKIKETKSCLDKNLDSDTESALHQDADVLNDLCGDIEKRINFLNN